MSADSIAVFRDSLQHLDVAFTETSASEFRDTLADIATEPAVGTSLPFDGVSLPSFVTTDPTTDELTDAKTGITPATFAIADYGSVALRPTANGESPVSLFPHHHIAVVARSDLVPGMTAAFARLEQILDGGGSAIFATGPSATADMGSLVRGVHGPKEVHVVLLSDR